MLLKQINLLNINLLHHIPDRAFNPSHILVVDVSQTLHDLELSHLKVLLDLLLGCTFLAIPE